MTDTWQPTDLRDATERLELDILRAVEDDRLVLVWDNVEGGNVYRFDYPNEDYGPDNVNEELTSLAYNDDFVHIADDGTVTLTDEGRRYMLHCSVRGAEVVPATSDPDQWASRIGDDPTLIVELVFARDVDTLRRLLTEEATHYRAFSSHSELIRTMAEATEMIKGRSKWWKGELDDHPEFVFPQACPHPCVDGWGNCEGCGGYDFSLDDEEPE